MKKGKSQEILNYHTDGQPLEQGSQFLYLWTIIEGGLDDQHKQPTARFILRRKIR